MSVWEKLERVEYEDLSFSEVAKKVKEAIEAGKPVRLVFKFALDTSIYLDYNIKKKRWTVIVSRVIRFIDFEESAELPITADIKNAYGVGHFVKFDNNIAFMIACHGRILEVIVEKPGHVALMGRY
jgi:KaiC/GvpD/RAD55 family RecA-like ATPase